MTRNKISATENAVAEKNIDMAFDLFGAALDDPSVLADIPEGVTLVLLPDIDSEHFGANVEIGLAAFR